MENPKLLEQIMKRYLSLVCFVLAYGYSILNISARKNIILGKMAKWPKVGSLRKRFFGTFKDKLKYYTLQSGALLQTDLNQFRLWYNHIRPHQNINNLTPAEVWSKTSHNKKDKHIYFSTWQGALNGFYLPPD